MGRVVSFFFTMFILIGLGFILGGIFGDIIGINLTILIVLSPFALINS